MRVRQGIIFKDCTQGWAVSAGLSHSRGMRGYDIEVEDAKGKRSIDMVLKPMSNVFGSVYYFWKLGKGNNHFHLQAGYSAKLSDSYYSFNDTYTPNPQRTTLYEWVSTGRVNIGCRFFICLI